MASEKILVVEDERHNLIALERILAFHGYEITAISNGEDAIAFPKPELFEVAILDLNLGRGIDGMEVLAHFRENAPDTIIILLTGNGTLETAVEALRQGAHDYLIKPARSSEIQASIQRGLEKRQKLLEHRKREVVFGQLEKNLEDSLNKLRGSEGNSAGKPYGDNSLGDNPNGDTTGSYNPPNVEFGPEGRYLTWNNIKVDLLRRHITVEANPLALSPTEYDLFLYLIKEAPRIVEPRELILEILGYDSDDEEASGVIRTHIYRLRQKINAVVPGNTIILTARGVGYGVGG